MLNEVFWDEKLFKKTSIEKYFSGKEKILFKATPDKKCFALRTFYRFVPELIMMIIFDIIFVMLSLSGQMNNVSSALIPLTFFNFIVIALILILFNKEKKNIDDIVYAITDKCVAIKNGPTGIDILEIDYGEIVTVRKSQTLLEKKNGVGSIHITRQHNMKSSGKPSLSLYSIKNHQEIYEKIKENVR